MPSQCRNRTRKKLLILCQNQFGYHVDAYYYCKYLREHFDITYLCWDYGLPEILMPEVNIIFVPRTGSIVARYSRYLSAALSEIRREQYDIHFIKYFRACFLLKVFNFQKQFVLDLRSGHISGRVVNRYVFDLLTRGETLFFRNITVISKSLARRSGLEKRAIILPLGADRLSRTKKTFESLRLLYVGTLTERNINQTLLGFMKFYNEFKDRIETHYTIIGTGVCDEEDRLRAIVRSKGLSTVVSVLGRIPHDRLKPYFDSHNVGVSFVPMTDYFDVQPVTKTFEYLLSGMPVIATATSENKLVLTHDNGVLIEDSPQGFYLGLKLLSERASSYNSGMIGREASKYLWTFIVKNFHKYLEENCASL
ncbi:glycosyltransferase [Desulfobacterota bacterium M19]